MKKKRIGRFSISWSLINEQPDLVRELMAGMLIINASPAQGLPVTDYIALSDHFDEVLVDNYINDPVPEYVWDIVQNNDSNEISYKIRHCVGREVFASGHEIRVAGLN